MSALIMALDPLQKVLNFGLENRRFSGGSLEVGRIAKRERNRQLGLMICGPETHQNESGSTHSILKLKR